MVSDWVYSGEGTESHTGLPSEVVVGENAAVFLREVRDLLIDLLIEAEDVAFVRAGIGWLVKGFPNVGMCNVICILCPNRYVGCPCYTGGCMGHDDEVDWE